MEAGKVTRYGLYLFTALALAGCRSRPDSPAPDPNSPKEFEVQVVDLTQSLKLDSHFQSYELSRCTATPVKGTYQTTSQKVVFKVTGVKEGDVCQFVVRGAPPNTNDGETQWLSEPGITYWAPEIPVSYGNRGQWYALARVSPAYRLLSQKTYQVTQLAVTVQFPAPVSNVADYLPTLTCEPSIGHTGIFKSKTEQTAQFIFTLTARNELFDPGLRCQTIRLYEGGFLKFSGEIPNFVKPLPLSQTHLTPLTEKPIPLVNASIAGGVP